MGSHFMAHFLLLVQLLLVHVDLCYSKDHYITPSLDSPCPQNVSSCLTLLQFAANSGHNETDISLLFLPGNHTLDREILLAHGHNFSMRKFTKDNDSETAFIRCTSQLGKFDIHDTVHAFIIDISFIGCGNNRVSQVTWLTIAGSTFQAVENKNVVLVMNEVGTAKLVNNQFLHNTLEHYDSDIPYIFLKLPEINNLMLPELVSAGSNYISRLQNMPSGVLYAAFSNVLLINCRFLHNRADIGGALVVHNSSLHIDKSAYINNTANFGGVMITSESVVDIHSSTFTSNSAQGSGGVMVTSNDLVRITNSAFIRNSASAKAAHGGVIVTYGDSSFTITISNSTFISNSVSFAGIIAITGNSSLTISNSEFTSNNATNAGVIAIIGDSSFNISGSNFTLNSARFGGVIAITGDSSFNIGSSNFTSNTAFQGGVIIVSGDSLFNISNSKFTSNSASTGGAIAIFGDSSFNISKSNFSSNHASVGGALYYYYDNIIMNSFKFGSNSVTINDSVFVNNNADEVGGVIDFTGIVLNIYRSHLCSNTVNTLGGGIIYMSHCSSKISNSTFHDNAGSIYAFNSNLTFSGSSTFGNSIKQLISTYVDILRQEGGAITSFQSTVMFAGKSSTIFSNSQSNDIGAILATESTIIMYGETTITNNNMITIANSSGGGISLKQSRLEIKEKSQCKIYNNSAVRGGGIHATSSTVVVYQSGILQFINNSAQEGGGMYLNLNSKLYLLKIESEYIWSNYYIRIYYYLKFTGNHANYGGAVYVSDDNNSGTCSSDNECFVQTIALHQVKYSYINTENIFFSENTATKQGTALFGGLLDRCIPSPFAEVYLKKEKHYSGVSYLQNISNATLRSISSQAVRVCFCNSKREPDCSYKLPPITVKKGETFNVSVVAVDQVNNTVNANITSTISSPDGGLNEGQQTQSVQKICTDLAYNVFSPHNSEIITLFANGPCQSATFSTIQVIIHFLDCTCPVGFEPLSNRNSSTRCECVCDSGLPKDITEAGCDYATSSVIRVDTNIWITHTNDTDPPGYVEYEYCPFDYCMTENVSINFNQPDGADEQCAYNRTGVLCGSCRENLSLSLASSSCLPCHSHWRAVCAVIILAAILAGILLVIALLALNMTVSVGLVNGFIFYVNIVSAGSSVFFPSTVPTPPSVFIAWLNLDIGIDVCFINGLDAYVKTWLQLAFPSYIIFLVIMLIIISEYSPKFAALIGRKDPISTLATLILLSYAKLLSVTITALSFARLDYPDGKQEIVWLPDGNVNYLQGKHIPLVLVALLIILFGLPYTILLFSWQWIVRTPKWNIFKWTRNTKLNAFITTYHAPHNSKYRYWTGLLLLVRVVLYVTASATASSNPQTLPLLSGILIGGLLIFKAMFAPKVYKNLLVDVVDTVLNFNLLALALFSLYDFKSDYNKQRAVADTSTIITFILLIGSIVYHIKLLIKKETPPQGPNEHPLVLIQPALSEVTHSVIDPPLKQNQDPSHDKGVNEREISKDCRNVTPPYTEQ